MMFEVLYNQNNSGLETATYLGPNYFDVRINGAALIKQEIYGDRVKTESKCCAPNGQWQKYSTDKILSASEDNSFSRGP
jgi:hypothetical protein